MVGEGENRADNSGYFLLKSQKQSKIIVMVAQIHKPKTTKLYPLGKFQFSSVAQLCPTLCYPMNRSSQASLSITNSQSLLKLMSIESMMPSNHLIHCRPLFLLPSIFPSNGVFSKESVLYIRWPKYWCFSFSISSFNEHSGLISFRRTSLVAQMVKHLQRIIPGLGRSPGEGNGNPLQYSCLENPMDGGAQ